MMRFVQKIAVTMALFYLWKFSATETCELKKEGIAVQCCYNYRLVNGNCVECPPGYVGLNCSYSCPDNHYGRLCDSKCNCTNGFICEKVFGCIAVASTEVSDSSTPVIMRWYAILGILVFALLVIVGVIFGVVQCSKCIRRHKYMEQNLEDLVNTLAPLTTSNSVGRRYDVPGSSASGGKSDCAMDTKTLKDTTGRHSFHDYPTIRDVSNYQTLDLKLNSAVLPLRHSLSNDNSEDETATIPSWKVNTSIKRHSETEKVIFQTFKPHVENVCSFIDETKIEERNLEYHKDENDDEKCGKSKQNHTGIVNPDEVEQPKEHTSILSINTNLSEIDKVRNISSIDKNWILSEFENNENMLAKHSLNDKMISSLAVGSSLSVEISTDPHQGKHAENDCTDRDSILYIGLQKSIKEEHEYSIPHDAQNVTGETILRRKDNDHGSAEKKMAIESENIQEEEEENPSVVINSVPHKNTYEKSDEDVDNIESEMVLEPEIQEEQNEDQSIAVYSVPHRNTCNENIESKREILEFGVINKKLEAVEIFDTFELKLSENILNEAPPQMYKPNEEGEMLGVKTKYSVTLIPGISELYKAPMISKESKRGMLQKVKNWNRNDNHNEMDFCKPLQREMPKNKFNNSCQDKERSAGHISHNTDIHVGHKRRPIESNECRFSICNNLNETECRMSEDVTHEPISINNAKTCVRKKSSKAIMNLKKLKGGKNNKTEVDQTNKSVNEKSASLTPNQSKIVQLKNRIQGSLRKTSHATELLIPQDLTSHPPSVDMVYTAPTPFVDVAHTKDSRGNRPYSFVKPIHLMS